MNIKTLTDDMDLQFNIQQYTCIHKDITNI
jgi:hypothetical protein